MWNLLKESPARREIYEKISNGNVYPLPYCKTRWYENEESAEQAAEIWPKNCEFMEHLMTYPKSIQAKNNISYDDLIAVKAGPLVCAKLKFAKMHLWKFSNPMFPFLYVSLGGLLRWWLLDKFILKETLAKGDSGRKLLKIKPKDVNIQKPADQIDIWSAAKLQIVEYKKKATYKESQVYTFCKEVMVLEAATAPHFMEKSPLKSLVLLFSIQYVLSHPTM